MIRTRKNTDELEGQILGLIREWEIDNPTLEIGAINPIRSTIENSVGDKWKELHYLNIETNERSI